MSVLCFGDDRSEGAETCWGLIAAHDWPGWDLEVITAESPEDMRPAPPDKSELHPWEPEDPRDGSAAGFDATTHLRAEVDPRVALISKVWDLVAIGARGFGMLRSIQLGSTADWLLREPTSPLLIARTAGRVSTILVATDGSPHATSAIQTLVSLPWLAGANVRVIAVEDRQVDAKAIVESTGEQISAHGADVETTIRRGNVTRSLMAEIEENTPDLVVMGARGHSGIRRLMVGSSTATVASGTECSMLVAHGS